MTYDKSLKEIIKEIKEKLDNLIRMATEINEKMEKKND